jgi:hypothetical protein
MSINVAAANFCAFSYATSPVSHLPSTFTVLGGYLSSNFEYGPITFVVAVYLFVFFWIITQFKYHVAIKNETNENDKEKKE